MSLTNSCCFIKNITWIILSLTLVSCNKEDFPYKKYFECTINNESFKSSQQLLPLFTENVPLASYNTSESNMYFKFFTDCNPVNTTLSLPSYSLDYKLYLNAPLEIGKKYTVQSLPNLDYLVSQDAESEYQEKRVSYCMLSYMSSYDILSFGNGFVEFTKIDIENNRIEGKVQFDILFPDEDIQNPINYKIIGEFRSNLN